MRTNAGFFAATCLLVLALTVPAGASQESGLDRDALRSGIARRVDNVVARQAGDKNREPITRENVTLKKVEPVMMDVDGHDIELYAVKAGLEFPDGSQADDLVLVVDSSGSLQFNVQAVDSGKSPFQSAKDKIQRKEIDPAMGETIYSGEGGREVVMASSPFCPYCRKAFNYFFSHKDEIGQWRMIDMTYEGQPGNNAAVWSVMDGKKVVDGLELMRFAYTALEPVQAETPEEQSEGVIKQFMQAFPKLAEKWGSAEQARYYLRGKYQKESLALSQEASKTLRIQATPQVFVDGIPVVGWAPARYTELLNQKQEKEKIYGQK